MDIERRLGGLVGDLYQRGGVFRFPEGVGEDNGDVLAIVEDAVALEREEVFFGIFTGAGVGALREVEAERIFVGEDAEDTGDLFGTAGVDFFDMAFGDSGGDGDAVGQIFEWVFGGVLGGTGDLLFAVDAVDGFSGDVIGEGFVFGAHAIPPAVVRARTRVRLASSILNALCCCGFADCRAASAALR